MKSSPGRAETGGRHKNHLTTDSLITNVIVPPSRKEIEDGRRRRREEEEEEERWCGRRRLGMDRRGEVRGGGCERAGPGGYLLWSLAPPSLRCAQTGRAGPGLAAPLGMELDPRRRRRREMRVRFISLQRIVLFCNQCNLVLVSSIVRSSIRSTIRVGGDEKKKRRRARNMTVSIIVAPT